MSATTTKALKRTNSYERQIDLIDEAIGFGGDEFRMMANLDRVELRTPNGRPIALPIHPEATILRIYERQYVVHHSDSMLDETCAALRDYAGELLEAAERMESEWRERSRR